MERRIWWAAAFLPLLVKAAIALHGSGPRAVVAALGAWTSLAGIPGWTPEMVSKVESEIGKRQG